MKNRSKPQFNTRVRKEVKSVADKLCIALDYTQEEIIEIAFAALVGTKDTVIEAKRLKAQMFAKELNLSFERANLQPVSSRHLVAA